jgi:RNA recognition motif-containing protein
MEQEPVPQPETTPQVVAQDGPDAQADPNKRCKKGRMFIGNLPFDINERHLRSLFQKFGEIAEVE